MCRNYSPCGLSGFGVPPEYRKSETFFLSEVFNFVLFDPVGWSVSQDAAFKFIVFPPAVFIKHLFGSCHTAVHIIYPAKKPIVHCGMKKVIDALDFFIVMFALLLSELKNFYCIFMIPNGFQTGGETK